jgi:PAS domain S-box-containing protein
MDETANEIKRLQGCINDLISVLALPAMWTGQDPEQIVSTLLDVLVGMLRLDFAYVRLNHRMGGGLIEVVRHDLLRPLVAESRSVGQTLNDLFGAELRKWPPRARNPFGDGNLSIVPLGSGGENDIGVIVAASQRADFPWQTETVLLNVASNQAAIGLASARAYEQERVRERLRSEAELERQKLNASQELLAETSHFYRELQNREAKIRRLVDANVVGIVMWNLEGAITGANDAFLRMVGYDREDLASGRVRWTDLTPREWRDQDERAIADLKANGVFQPCEKEYFRKNGSRVPILIGGALFEDSGSEGVAFVLDLSDQKRAEDQLRAVMSERTRLSAFRAEIAMAVASKDTLRGILHRCAETMVRHFDAAFARIWTLKSGGTELELEASAGMYTRLDGRFSRIPVGHLKIGLIARERKAHLTNDVENDPRISDHNWAKTEKMQSFAGYPLVVEDRVVGVMGVFSRQTLTESALETLAFIADGIAQGIDRKRAEDALKLLKDQLYRENIALRDEVVRASMFDEIVGTSNPLKAVLSRISRVAPTDSTVLITGETGTGKELIARAIHKKSPRAGRAFVSINCAAIPHDLIPSELFGHEKGAFTGATQRRLGRFELADGGTIFLDEVGELLPDTQVALLRVLQERELERVGGGQPIHVDVRVIAATNRDLEAAVANGTFRQDLFYRLNVFPIEVPPLRERKDDLQLLVEYFVQRYGVKAGKDIRSIEKKTLDLLQSYEWPGNIRELQNVIERSVILSSGGVFSVDELWLSKKFLPLAPPLKASPSSKSQVTKGLVEALSEREIIEAALAATRGRVSGPSGAASKLGIPPSTLETRIKVLKIDKLQFKFR